MLSIAHFWSMRRPVRSLVYLFWIYSFVSRAVTAFTQIYIYQVFSSVELNIVAGIAMFAGCMIGFCVYGAIAAQCRLNAKHGFPLSFVVTGLGLILLPLARDVTEACAAITVRGIGFGLFWLTIHTYELMETRDHERDVYSTFASTGDQIVTVASPAFATLLIWLSHSLGAGDFTLLFVVTPPIFLLGLPSIGALPDYRPEPIKKHDLVHFLTDRHNQAAQIYLMGGAASHILQQTIIPLASIIVLGTTLNAGSFNTVFAIAGALALPAVGSLMALNFMLGYSLTFAGLIVYTIGSSIIQPINRVSQHVIDLKTMDGMAHSASDFYPAMILRDVALWGWRTAAALILLPFASGAATGHGTVSLGMYMIAGSIAATYAGARVLLRWKR